MRKFLLCCAGLGLLGSSLTAGEHKLMHCFAFTPVESASPADWDAFYKATDMLPSKIKGITHVWYGKLTGPLTVYSKASGGDYAKRVREYGVCMEMRDEAARKAYGTDPYHKDWEAAYSKVRQPGTTTFDFMGQ